MPGWILTILFFVGSTLIIRLFSPRPSGPTASSLGDFQVPTATEDRPIPVLYGTVNVKGPNVVWYGDLGIRPIKVSGGLFAAKQTVGYKYDLGEQLTIGHGILDELIEIRFDDRSIPDSILTIHGGNRDIRFGDAFTTYTASIATGNYTSLSALALAAGTAMIAAYGPSSWKCVWGYDIVPGQTDEITYAVKVGATATNYTVHIAPGSYSTGSALATAIAAALNANEAGLGGGARVSFSCAYSGTRFTLSATALVGGLDGWWLRGIVDYTKTALATIGVQYGQDYFQTGFPTSYVSDYDTGARRFVFAFGGLAGRLHLEDPLFTSRSTLGFIASGSYFIIRAHLGDFDIDLAGSRIYDLGEYWSVVVNQPDFFGGDNQGGGVIGTFDVYKGTLTQVANGYLQSILGTLPAYRGVAYAVAERPYLGTSPYLKNISFVVRRCPNQLGVGGGKHNVLGDANPACAIYEILTNKRWGRGLDPGAIDNSSFLAAADALYTEASGISMVFDRAQTAADMLAEIERHIDGVVYPDPATAKLVLKLARADYVVGSLPLLTAGKDDVGAVKLARPSWGETVNDVRIRFVERLSWTERIAQAQDLASLQSRGELSSEEFDFRGISSAAAADRVAARVLKTVSYPLAHVEIPAKRLAYALRPGDVFKLDDADLGIAGLVLRVNRIRTGKLTESAITIEAVEDIFAVNGTGYTPIPVSGWTDPAGLPDPLAASELVESPYALLLGPDRYVATLAARGARPILGYQVWTDPAGGAAYSETNEILGSTPTGVLTVGIGYTDTSLTLNTGVDLDVLGSVSDADLAAGRSVFYLDGEFISYKTVSGSAGVYTFSGLVRGVMDTTPRAHVLGARAWFLSEGFGTTDASPYGTDLTVAAKLLPFTSLGSVALADGVALSLATNSRATRPYVPTAVTINAASYPASIDGSTFTVAWSHRNRLGAWNYSNAGLTGSPEAGTTYTVRLYGDAGTLLRTATGISGTSYAWTTEAADSGGALNTVVRVTVEALVAGVGSFVLFDYTVPRTGFGGAFGVSFG